MKGVMSWKFHNAKTAASSRGVASFEYGVVLDGEVPRIAAETSSVNEEPSAASNSLEQVGRNLQEFFAQLRGSRPANPPERAAIRPKAPIAR